MSQGVESDLDSGDDESIHNASLEEADELFKQQSKTIREIAEKESCVIVGRCADYVLEGAEGLVRVFLYADMEYREKRISDLAIMSQGYQEEHQAH